MPGVRVSGIGGPRLKFSGIKGQAWDYKKFSVIGISHTAATIRQNNCMGDDLRAVHLLSRGPACLLSTSTPWNRGTTRHKCG
jgi:hypothetical protein